MMGREGGKEGHDVSCRYKGEEKRGPSLRAGSDASKGCVKLSLNLHRQECLCYSEKGESEEKSKSKRQKGLRRVEYGRQPLREEIRCGRRR